MKNTLFFIIAAFFYGSVNAQVNMEVPQVIPPAPNAAALARYADIPVSKYSGVPGISIPLYTIQVGEFQLPITLSYHSSGIRVSQEASSVGLGWVLNAGGCITRQVRSLPDFGHSGYESGFLNSPDLPPFGSYEGTVSYLGGGGKSVAQQIADFYQLGTTSVFAPFINVNTSNSDHGVSTTLVADTESDLYSFNFAGYAGKFVINKDGSGELFAPESGLIFQVIDYSNWQVIDQKGVTYIFSEKEYTRPYSFSQTNYGDNLLQLNGGSASHRYISSWYISQIILPNNESIFFEYDNDVNRSSWSYGPISASWIEPIDHTTICGDSYSTINTINQTYSKSSSLNDSERYLKSIMWPSGKIDFSTSDRLDRHGTSTIPASNPQKTDNMVISNMYGEQVRNINFNYSYFNAHEIGQLYDFLKIRLKLDSVTIDDLVYAFSYEKPNELPYKYDLGYDHWGFYNGQTNRTPTNEAYVIPELYIMDTQWYEEEEYFEGANRDANSDVICNGILKSIVYPTKGEVKFEYELNEFDLPIHYLNTSYGLIKYEDRVIDHSIDVVNYAIAYHNCYVNQCIPDNDHTEATFTITETTAIDVKFQYYPYGSQPGSYPVPTDGNGNGAEFASITCTDGGSFSKGYHMVIGSISETYEESLSLNPGTYRVSVHGTGYHFGAIGSIEYSEIKDLPSNKIIKGGGLRISKIISDQNTREFTYQDEYDPTKTSGKLLVEPSYYYRSDEFYCTKVKRLESNSVRPLTEGSSSAIIGYSYVQESVHSGSESSVTKSKYRNVSENTPKGSYIPIVTHHGNGLLLEESYWTNSRLLRKQTIEYNEVLFNFYNDKYYVTIPIRNGNYVGIYYYPIRPKWYQKEHETTIDYFYDENGNSESVINLSDFLYNDENYQVNNITTTDSHSNTLVTKITYPNDYTYGTPYSTMIDKNMVAIPIETTNLRNGYVTSANLITFSHLPGGLILPKKYYSLGTSNPILESSFLKYQTWVSNESGYEEVASFDKYDDQGRILQVTSKDGNIISYLWGYKNQYPVAKIQGASHDEVLQVQDFSLLPVIQFTDDGLRSYLQDLRTLDAQVTIYTYSPLIGITSKTDPAGITSFFEYDDYGRLKNVKDSDGNIVSHTEYQYAD